MKTVVLSDTQYTAILQALSELADEEHACCCNDIFAGDKFHLLTPEEQLEARKLINLNEVIYVGDGEPPDEIPTGFNSTATEYLKYVIEQQHPTPPTE